MTISAAIIGLGGIGMLYDLRQSESVSSHARSFTKHPYFELVGAVDTNGSLRKTFVECYGVHAFASIPELVSYCYPEVVVVATPTATHFDIIKDLLTCHKPQLILCEKPLAYCPNEAEAIVDLCKLHGVELFVNYHRRADPAVIEVKSRITKGEIVAPFKAVVWYSKGLIHNGSHFLDLLIFWFGPVLSLKLISNGRELGSYDAEPDFKAEFGSGTAIFCATDSNNFAHNTLEVIAKNGRLRYEQGGIVSWEASGRHAILEDCNQLQLLTEMIDNDVLRCQYHIADFLMAPEKVRSDTLCGGFDGARIVSWLSKLINERS